MKHFQTEITCTHGQQTLECKFLATSFSRHVNKPALENLVVCYCWLTYQPVITRVTRSKRLYWARHVVQKPGCKSLQRQVAEIRAQSKLEWVDNILQDSLLLGFGLRSSLRSAEGFCKGYGRAIVVHCQQSKIKMVGTAQLT